MSRTKSKNQRYRIQEYTDSKLSEVQVYSPEYMKEHGILCVLYGVLSDFSKENRNGRWYSLELWEKVFKDPLFIDALKYKSMSAESDHPLEIENRLESHGPNVCGFIRDPKIDYEKQCIYGYVDIIDNVEGRNVYSWVKYGTTPGVSSRGCGDILSDGDKTFVDPDTFTFVTWDIVLRPSNEAARLTPISVDDKPVSLKDVTESISYKDVTNLKSARTLIEYSSLPNKDDILNKIDEAINYDPEKDIDHYKSDINASFSRIEQLKEENSKLTESLKKKDETIRVLEDGQISYHRSLKSENETSSNDGSEKRDSECNVLLYDEIRTIKESLNNLIDVMSTDQTTENVESENKKLKSELDSARKELDESKSQSNKYLNLANTYVNEYFKLRCSQLGINERIARSRFIGNLCEYGINQINTMLREMYSLDDFNSPSDKSANNKSNQMNSVIPNKYEGYDEDSLIASMI